MTLKRCYLDGSEDSDGKVFGVGGFIGNAEDWDSLQPMWIGALPVGVEYFHATDCFSGNNQFKGIPIPARMALLDTLTDYIVGRDLKLICHGVDVPAYHQYASRKRKIDPFGQNKYGVCFGGAVGLACQSIGDHGAGVEVKCAFTIERDEFEETAKREFSMLRSRPEIGYRDRIGTETYGDKTGDNAIPLLQVADLGAFLGVKYLGKCHPGRIDWRPYYHKLRSAGRICKCVKDKPGKLKAMNRMLESLKHGNQYRLP
jgi:hypothetical protein